MGSQHKDQKQNTAKISLLWRLRVQTQNPFSMLMLGLRMETSTEEKRESATQCISSPIAC